MNIPAKNNLLYRCGLKKVTLGRYVHVNYWEEMETTQATNPKADRIYAVLTEEPGQTPPEIQQQTGFTLNTVRYNLLLLLAYRVIEKRVLDTHRPGHQRYGYYPIVDKEADR